MLEELPREVAEKLKEMLKRLKSIFPLESAYLYGSYAKGTWLKTSDLDLIVVSKGFKNLPFMKRLDLVNRISWELGENPHIEVIPLTPEELEAKKKSSILIRNASKYWLKIPIEDL